MCVCVCTYIYTYCILKQSFQNLNKLRNAKKLPEVLEKHFCCNMQLCKMPSIL